MQGIDYYISSDNQFDNLFAVHLQPLSATHWTPVQVARVAASFLAQNKDAQILDIGAGVGKFCIAGGIVTDAYFTGIELKKNYVAAGNKVIKQLGLRNVSLINGNFTELSITKFTGIYFYNSFHENLFYYDEPDNSAGDPNELYDLYTKCFLNQITYMPTGTRLATYWLSVAEIPGCYRLVESLFEDKLKLWIKTEHVIL